ncbi:unnamed protein product [Arabidopsis arenosa]|uniref:Uncharacterized protein n=1 Tax=Arabidopsis arenosa TaxID=38785 RepID=A0A8S2AVB8_ARAAE|nr:unnamed protein product [Arabidopsis arenosa]
MRKGGKEEDEVEQLLQAAQDEMILKLSVDSHTSRSSSDYLDPDLHSRFLALKSQKKKDQQRQQHKRRPRSPTKLKDLVEETPDDLMLRFTALKTSLPSASSSSSVLLQDEIGDDGDEIGEDAEVEKLIQWAIDAARLDPSPPSDDDQSQSSDSDDENDSTRVVKP